MEPVAFNAAAWSTFFGALVSAAAALTGLLFVSLSINLAQVVAEPLILRRSFKALLTLAWLLISSMMCLVPGQAPKDLGWHLVTTGGVLWMVVTYLQMGAMRGNRFIAWWQRALLALLAQAAVVPFLLCGASLVLHRGSGLNWMVTGTIFSLVSALVDAWVLLIEIRR